MTGKSRDARGFGDVVRAVFDTGEDEVGYGKRAGGGVHIDGGRLGGDCVGIFWGSFVCVFSRGCVEQVLRIGDGPDGCLSVWLSWL